MDDELFFLKQARLATFTANWRKVEHNLFEYAKVKLKCEESARILEHLTLAKQSDGNFELCFYLYNVAITHLTELMHYRSLHLRGHIRSYAPSFVFITKQLTRGKEGWNQDV